MKYLLSVSILLTIRISAIAQEHKDARDWLSEIEEPPIERITPTLRDYNHLKDLSSPSIYAPKPYEPGFDLKPLKPLKLSIPSLYLYNDLKSIKYSVLNPASNLTIKGNVWNNNSFGVGSMNFMSRYINIEYKYTPKLSLNLHGNYISTKYQSAVLVPVTPFQYEIGANLSYNINKNLKLKSGMQYMYNAVTGRWEYVFMTGIALDF